jgi:hypothetical protein
MVDHSIANRVTENVATVVDWSYAHDFPFLAIQSVKLLQTFDDMGSLLISIVIWLVANTK